MARIRGDRDDVLSRGYLCPKGPSLKQLHDDPDRIRRPLIRQGTTWFDATWEDCWEFLGERFEALIATYGRHAMALFLGNACGHNLGIQTYVRQVILAMHSPNVFTSSTVDQRSREVALELMFGSGSEGPVPDLDRTQLLMIVGANPMVSNGSLVVAPDFPRRMREIVDRNGEIVVIDPQRTKTAEAATEYHSIRPGTDALFLLAIVSTLFDENLVRPHQPSHLLAGLDTVAELAARFPPEAVQERTGIAAATARSLARRLATAESAAVYGRIGSSAQPFGTVTSWLIEVINILTGNLDRPGGVMFPLAAATEADLYGGRRTRRQPRIGRRFTRVRQLPETLGEMPSVALAEEILEPGEGRIRGLITIGGNPALSVPNRRRMEEALQDLDLLVSVDLYMNETSRHAHVLLPPPDPLSKEHYDLTLLQYAVRNVANFSPAVLPLGAGSLEEWKILLKLAALLRGDNESSIADLDQRFIRGIVEHNVAQPSSRVHRVDVEHIMTALAVRSGPTRALDFLLRVGPYGDRFSLAEREGHHSLNLDTLLRHPHGVDLGPLKERLTDVLATPSGLVELAPPSIVDDVSRLLTHLHVAPEREFLMVGRRELRTNNSWMHNLEILRRGKAQGLLHVNTEDGQRLGLIDGQLARVTSDHGAVTVKVEMSSRLMPGVVSLPHGWGHTTGTRLRVAQVDPGASYNDLICENDVEALSGNAILNGIEVDVVPV